MSDERPFRSAFRWFVGIVVVGTLLSFGAAIIQGEIIARGARENNPGDPLDLLPFLVLGFIFVGFIASSLLGLLVGSLVYLTKKTEIADRDLVQTGTHL